MDQKRGKQKEKEKIQNNQENKKRVRKGNK